MDNPARAASALKASRASPGTGWLAEPARRRGSALAHRMRCIAGYIHDQRDFHVRPADLGPLDVTPPPAEAGGFSLCRVGVATDQPGGP
jgi:hypothetical protein